MEINETCENNVTICTIKSNSLAEILNYCIPRIRLKSREFYSREITESFNKKGKALVDQHAGQGTIYIILRG